MNCIHLGKYWPYWPVLYLFANSFQYSWLPLYVCHRNSPLNICSILLVSSLINDCVGFLLLHDNYHKHSINNTDKIISPCVSAVWAWLNRVLSSCNQGIGSGCDPVWGPGSCPKVWEGFSLWLQDSEP